LPDRYRLEWGELPEWASTVNDVEEKRKRKRREEKRREEKRREEKRREEKRT
jgi:hypothetical protein